jgi:hypothetical protein
MWNDGAIGVMLDAIAADITHLALHDGYPGTNFANEKSGGSPAYARETVTWPAYVSGRTLPAQTVPSVFDITGAVSWVTGATDESTSTGQRFAHPLDGIPKEFDVDPTTDIFLIPAHGYSNGQLIVPYGSSVAGGLTAGVNIYVRDATTDTFKVEASIGGGAIDITSRPSTQGALISKITIYDASQRQFTVNGLVLALQM